MTVASLRLEKLQLISVVTRLLAMACAVVQGIIVLRSLGPERYGLLGVAVAVAALVGAAQHLGLGVGTLKAIARHSTEPSELARLIPCAVLLRVVVTLPVAVILATASSLVAHGVYDEPRLARLLILSAATLVFTSLNEATDSILNGMQLFREVFLLRTAAAFVLLVAVGSSTVLWGVVGYFAGALVASMVTAAAYLSAVWWRVQGAMHWPDWKSWRLHARPILSTGLLIYFAQFGETAFFQSGILYLGQVASVEDVSYLKLAIGTGMYLLTLSAAVNSVSLPLFTSAAISNVDEYAQRVVANFRSVWMLLLLVGVGVIVFAREVVLVLAGEAYLPAARILPLAVASVIFFSGYTLIGAKVFLPKNEDRAYAGGFIPIVAVTFLAGGSLQTMGTGAMGWAGGMLIGSLAGFALAVKRTRQRLGLRLLDARLTWLTGMLAVAMAVTYLVEGFLPRLILIAIALVLSPYRAALFGLLRTLKRRHAVQTAGGAP